MSRRTIGPIALLLAAIVLSAAFVPSFATRTNISYLLLQSVPLLLIAAGQTLVIITAGIDLSVGASATLAGVIASGIMQPGHGGTALALLVCVLAAIVVGVANAVMVVRYNLPPFLATLGTTFFLAGTNLYLRPTPGGFIPESFQKIAKTSGGLLPPAAVVTLVVLAALAFYLEGSRFGLRLRAVGGDEARARLAGVSPGAVKLVAYVASALLAMLAGLFIAARTGTGDPLVGDSYQLAGITAAVLGGANLAGGQGNIWGAISGALVLTMIGNVLNLLGVVAYWQWIIQGLVLIVAVAIYSLQAGESLTSTLQRMAGSSSQRPASAG